MVAKKTKITATISDRRCDVEFLTKLYNAGMNVVRINSAHVTPESAMKVVNNVRAVSDKIAILIDTKGPEMRLTSLKNDTPVEVKKGDVISLKGEPDKETSSECVYVNYSGVYNDVPLNSFVLIDDGELEMKVIKKENNTLFCEILNSGFIKSRKSVNIPNTPINLPSLTDKDKDFIHWAIDNDLDFVAHSFVRRKEDLEEINAIIAERNSTLKVISKIENREGVDNIDEILDHTYGIMVARGDLGVEIPAEEIPQVQRVIVRKCIKSKKPVIIATQMLHTMITNPRPTRAEITDIASAIYQRADSVMLSGETANGDYPEEAVKVMSRVALEIEKYIDADPDISIERINNEIAAQLCRSAIRSSINLPVKAIVIDSKSGRTGRYMSSFRGTKPVLAICYLKSTVRHLSLSYGIDAEFTEKHSSREDFLKQSAAKLKKKYNLNNEDLVISIGGSFTAAQGASFIEISSVKNLLAL